MADKITVTMYHPEATESIEVMLSQVKTAELNGWTIEKPVEVKIGSETVVEVTDYKIDSKAKKETKKGKFNKTKCLL